MAINMRYGFLCDYATIGANGKPIAVHIFDHFSVQGEPDWILSNFTLLARFECSLADGGSHVITGDVVDEDGQVTMRWSFPDQTFVTQGPGLPLIRSVTLQITGLRIKKLGVYEIVFRSKAAVIGQVQFRVLSIPKAAGR